MRLDKLVKRVRALECYIRESCNVNLREMDSFKSDPANLIDVDNEDVCDYEDLDYDNNSSPKTGCCNYFQTNAKKGAINPPDFQDYACTHMECHRRVIECNLTQEQAEND